MNYIELAREAKRETGGMSGGGPTSIALASMEDLRILGWVRDAWRELDLMHETWNWRQSAGQATTTAMVIAPATFGITDFARWRQHNREYAPTAYRSADGVQTERPLVFLTYDRFRRMFMTGVHQPGSLQYWSVSPAGEFVVGPTPDSQHVVRADYIRRHTPLVLDTDVPALPEDFHMLIVWRALREYGGFDAATEAYMRADRNVQTGMASLRQSCMPAIRFGGRGLA